MRILVRRSRILAPAVTLGIVLAMLLFASFGARLPIGTGVSAQEATPAASPVAEATAVPVQLAAWTVGDPMSPSAEQCTVAPASTDDVAASLLELESRQTLELTAGGDIAAPATGPADQTSVDGVLATLTQFWACNNAGQRAALVSVMTPNGIADLYDLDLSGGEEAVRAGVAAALTPGEPRGLDALASFDAIPAVVFLDDGRVAAYVLNTDPEIAGGAQVLDLFVFVDQEGTFLIDSYVGDPFDMIAGYGFDAE